MAFVQRIGRGLRVAPGKVDCIILDHAGNHLHLGIVTDIHQDHLDEGGKGENDKKREAGELAEPLPKLCDECKAVIPPKAKECHRLRRAGPYTDGGQARGRRAASSSALGRPARSR